MITVWKLMCNIRNNPMNANLAFHGAYQSTAGVVVESNPVPGPSMWQTFDLGQQGIPFLVFNITYTTT